MKTELSNIRKNIMGTTSFDLKIEGMRKAQDFIVYPISANNDKAEIKIQSDKRIALLNLNTGECKMSQNHAGGAYFHHLQLDTLVCFTLSNVDLEALRLQIMTTASSKAGSRGITCDNSGAVSILDMV